MPTTTIPDTPPEVSLAALDELVKEGKVRHLAASNFTPERLEEALSTAEREGLATYEVLQPHYNLLERGFESTLEPVASATGWPPRRTSASRRAS